MFIQDVSAGASSVGKNNVSTRDPKTARRAHADEKFRVKFLEKRSARRGVFAPW